MVHNGRKALPMLHLEKLPGGDVTAMKAVNMAAAIAACAGLDGGCWPPQSMQPCNASSSGPTTTQQMSAISASAESAASTWQGWSVWAMCISDTCTLLSLASPACPCAAPLSNPSVSPCCGTCSSCTPAHSRQRPLMIAIQISFHVARDADFPRCVVCSEQPAAHQVVADTCHVYHLKQGGSSSRLQQ